MITGDTTEHGTKIVGEKKGVFPGSGGCIGEIRETQKNEWQRKNEIEKYKIA